ADVGDIQSRLLDHRPVLQGEIRYFVREFEDKRAFRECRLLENINKLVTETEEQVLPRCTKNMGTDLANALSCCMSKTVLFVFVSVNHMAQRIQQREVETQQSILLQEGMEKRKNDWEDFLKEQAKLKEEVDDEHVKAVSRLTTQYSEMKKDLAK
ncbi:biogenesis of lysosome-related organelles complex 1 subunit 5, partial [Silurus asotus]